MTLYVTKTIRDLVTEALRVLNVVEGTSEPTAGDMLRGARALQTMLKTLQSEGMTIWLRRDADITIAESVADYDMANEGLSIRELVYASIIEEDDEEEHEQPLAILSRLDYKQQPDKAVQGKPTQVYFNVTETDQTLIFWPTPDDTFTVRIDYRQEFTNQTDENDEIEVPDYWIEALIYKLAERLLIPYGFSGTPTSQEVRFMSKDLYDTASAFDVVQDGGGIIHFVPDR